VRSAPDMKKSFLAKSNWCSRSLFHEISSSGWTNPGIDPRYQDFFLADLAAEYDAINLYQHLYPARHDFSPYFVQYLDFWFSDERNHADGFFELNRLIFDIEEDQLIDRLKARTGNFDEIQCIADTEFKLLLLFAYDEYISVQTYKKDTFYRDFGHPAFNIWIKKLISDEAIRFGNAIKILRTFFSTELNKAEHILNDIISIEQTAYNNTFLFDHDGPHFQLDKNEVGTVVINEILTILRKR